MKRNLTIQLDETTIKQARLVAAGRSISISQLVREEIARLAASQETRARDRKKVALARLDKGYHLGRTKLPKREEIYDRPDR